MTNEELVYLYQQGDKTALNDLIEQNTGIVYKLVNKFYVEGTNSIDKEDLEQEGYLGLIVAADKYKFDVEHPCKFITYAVYWIYQKIQRYMKQKNTNNEISLNTSISKNGDNEIMDYIEGVDYSFENVEEKLYNQQLHQELEDVMNEHNTLKEREIIKFHYGWDNIKCMSLYEIGDILGITGERARQLKDNALRTIRNSKWARKKAIEIYGQKKRKAVYSIPGTVRSISFAERYLSNGVI